MTKKNGKNRFSRRLARYSRDGSGRCRSRLELGRSEGVVRLRNGHEGDSVGAVAIFSSVVIAHAADAPKSHAQKASVVTPILEKIKSGGDPVKIVEILGFARAGAMDRGLTPIGPSAAGHTRLGCTLDDGSFVDMWVWSVPGHGNGIISIGLKRANEATEQIYPPSK